MKVAKFPAYRDLAGFDFSQSNVNEALLRSLHHCEFQQKVLSKIPLNRIGKVEDVAAAVLYFASSASNMVTGDSLKVDGGWTAI